MTETTHLLPPDAPDSMFHVCRRCRLAVDNWSGPPTHWPSDDLCCACSHALGSEALRAMARRVVKARQDLNAETREILDSQSEALREVWVERARARHARHWMRGRLAQWLVGHAYALGLISSSGTSWGGGGCNGCVTVRWRGRRPYVLGWSREQWHCLLVGHHRRTEIPGAGLCTICAPCWVCQSAAVDHDSWACELAAEQSSPVLSSGGQS